MATSDTKQQPAATQLTVPIAWYPAALQPSTTEEQTEDETEDAKLIITEDEIGRFAYFGLGRGINGAEKTPWLNKLNFEVRCVKFQDIVGTEEGGMLKSYVNQISSTSSLQSTLKATVSPASPVCIGVDAELARGSTTNRRAVGKRIINRTIAFKDHLEDLYGDDDESSSHDFEKKLCKRILQKLEYRRGEVPNPSDDSKEKKSNPIYDFVCMLKHSTDREQLKKDLKEECSEFVNTFQLTHYVSAIEIGAAEYEVLTEEAYNEKVGGGFSIGVPSIKKSKGSLRSRLSRKKKSHKKQKVGVIKDGGVERGTLSEAVVGVKICSITRLVGIPELKGALRSAIEDYLEDQCDKSAGPFYIACNNDSIFLKVNENHQVEGTENLSEASEFFILPNDDVSSEVTFSITYKQPSSKPTLEPISYYLSAPVGLLGYYPGPLEVEESPQMYDTTFTLQDRRKQGNFVQLSEWTTGEKIFYIRSPGGWFFPDSYLCVKEACKQGGAAYITACQSSIACSGGTTYLLFRLIHGKNWRGFNSSTGMQFQQELQYPIATSSKAQFSHK